MGNFTNEYDWALYTNLLSRRTKIRRIKTGRDKMLRQKRKEYDRKWNEIRNLGYELLKVPIQKGYKRLFILTEDTRYSQQSDFYQKILDKINNIRYSPHKNFERQKTAKKRRNRRKYKTQTLLEPESWHFHNMLKFNEDERRMFYHIHYKCCPTCNRTHEKYVFAEPWRYVLSVKPNILTEVQRKDSVLEQECAELSDFLDMYSNKARSVKMWGGNTYTWKKIQNKKEDIKRYSYNSLRNIQIYQLKNEYDENKDLIFQSSN